MAKKVTGGVYRCTQGFAAATKTGMVRVAVGKLVPFDVGYDVMTGREDHFEDVSQPRGAVVEQASAAPGEKRSVRKSA